jgi:hypothetical protein
MEDARIDAGPIVNRHSTAITRAASTRHYINQALI